VRKIQDHINAVYSREVMKEPEKEEYNELFLKDKPQFLINQKEWLKLISVLKDYESRVISSERRIEFLEKRTDIIIQELEKVKIKKLIV
jgi:hypothetical protein